MRISAIFTLLSCATALDNGLGLTPPMGWNSWNRFGKKVNESAVIGIIDGMVSTGLRDAGYVYVNLDDCWSEMERDSDGRLVADSERFPSGIKYLADYAHSKGLKFGIYSDAGTKTCAGYPGSLGYEEVDANTFAEWEVDFLKYDNCNAQNLSPKERYPAMTKALNATGRPIFFHLCVWGYEEAPVWGKEYGNMWRIGISVHDNFDSIMVLADDNNIWADYGGPGGWNDPDFLQVGNGGMSIDEYKSHMALWALMKSPLIFGADPNTLSQEMIDLLTNPEVIAINQDPLGVQGRRVLKYLPETNTDYTKVHTLLCVEGRAAQQWTLNEDNTLSSQGMCLEVPGCSNGTVYVNGDVCHPGNTSYCSNSLNQEWKYNPETKQIISAMNGKCMDFKDHVGSYMWMKPCSDSTSQQWIFHDDGTIRLAEQNETRCLTMADGVWEADVWAGPLSNGEYVALLLNGSLETREVVAPFSAIGITSAAASARDLWERADLGVFTGEIKATLAPHASLFVKLTPK